MAIDKNSNAFYVDDNIYKVFSIIDNLRECIDNTPKFLRKIYDKRYDEIYESLSPIKVNGITYDFIFCFSVFFNSDFDDRYYIRLDNRICTCKISDSYFIGDSTFYMYLPYLYIECGYNNRYINMRISLDDENNIIINLLDLSNRMHLGSMNYRTDQYEVTIKLSSLQEYKISNDIENIPDSILLQLSNYNLTIYDIKDIICDVLYRYIGAYIKGNRINKNAGMKNFRNIIDNQHNTNSNHILQQDEITKKYNNFVSNVNLAHNYIHYNK